MGILTINENTEIFPKIKELYEVIPCLSYAKQALKPEAQRVSYGVLSAQVERMISNEPLTRSLDETMRSLCWLVFGLLYKPKYNNGLPRKVWIAYDENDKYIYYHVKDYTAVYFAISLRKL